MLVTSDTTRASAMRPLMPYLSRYFLRHAPCSQDEGRAGGKGLQGMKACAGGNLLGDAASDAVLVTGTSCAMHPAVKRRGAQGTQGCSRCRITRVGNSFMVRPLMPYLLQ